MKRLTNTVKLGLASALLATAFSGCNSDATTASQNLAKAAENFEIDRRIIFVNTMTDKVLAVVEGKCSLENQKNELEVTCKYGEDFAGNSLVRKTNLGLSRNVTYVSTQLESIGVNVYHTRIMFKPQSIIPDIDLKSSSKALKQSVSFDNNDK